MSDTKKLAEELAEKIRREEGRDVKVVVREHTEDRENEVADRVAVILNRFDDLRLPFRKRKAERRLKRKQVVNGFFEGMRRSGEGQNEESLKEENERLRRQLKKEKDEEEDHGFAGMGVRRTKDGKEIAIEF